MTTFQFIVEGVTLAEIGKKQNTQIQHKKSRAIVLMKGPARPRLHRRGGKGGPLKRRIMTQPIETMYVEIRALVPIDVMAWKATVLPMLIRDNKLVMRNEMRTAFSGMFQPGRIWVLLALI
jgi:hypothetical protein